MRIVVCLKAVPSTTEVRMDPKTNTIIRDGAQSVVNPFDTAGLEVALQIREKVGGTIGVLSMGIPDTTRLLHDAICRGADDALLLSDRAFAGADTLATSYALTRGLDHMGEVDLVVCGKMAVDGDTAQIGPEIAAARGMACVTGVHDIVEVTEHDVTVECERDGQTLVVKAPLPAVITVAKDAATLRMPTIAGIRAAEGARVQVLDAQGVQADAARCGLDGSPTQVVRSFVPERTSEAVKIEGDAREQAASLAAIIGGMSL